MMSTASFGLGLLCAAMMAVMCLPMAVGMIRRWRRQRPTALSARAAATDVRREIEPAEVGPLTPDAGTDLSTGWKG